jgi:hypothetical protein
METGDLATDSVRQELPNRCMEKTVPHAKTMITQPLSISSADNKHGTNDAYRSWAKNL